MTRREAIRKIYRKLRSRNMNPLEVAAALYALDVTVDELEPVVREYGDLPSAAKK